MPLKASLKMLGMLIALLLCAFLLSLLHTKKDPAEYINDVALKGFIGVPAIIHQQARDLAENYASDTVAVAPDARLDTIELIKWHERSWTNSCLSETNAYPDTCKEGAFSGYEAIIKVDSEYQLWRMTSDGSIGDIAANIDLREIAW